MLKKIAGAMLGQILVWLQFKPVTAAPFSKAVFRLYQEVGLYGSE
ncbi:hypothetical protein RLH01_00250 [Streptococcus pneumoniae]|nr:hypothetical protein [Streptococcus pneumoniae]